MSKLVSLSEVEFEHLAFDQVCMLESSFTLEEPTFKRRGVVWRSNELRDRIVLAIVKRDPTALQVLVDNLDYMPLTCRVRTRVYGDGFLMMFRTSQEHWPQEPFIIKRCGVDNGLNRVPPNWWQRFLCGDCVQFFRAGQEDALAKVLGQLCVGQPWMLMPYEPAYPGIDAVLLSCKGGQKHALLMQTALTRRHLASELEAEAIAAWCARVSAAGFKPWLVYCVQPCSLPYPEQDRGGAVVDQLYVTWMPGRIVRRARSVAETPMSARG